MCTASIELIERMRGKKMSSEEKDVFIRLGRELGSCDNDALWQILAVLEFHKTFYLDLPEKIDIQVQRIMAEISKGAEKEAALAQGKLVECVVAEAKNLNLKSKISTIMLLGLAALISFILICSLMMWAGYGLGTGKIIPPEYILRMPSGLIVGLLALACGGILAHLGAKQRKNDQKSWWQPCLGATLATIFACVVLAISL